MSDSVFIIPCLMIMSLLGTLSFISLLAHLYDGSDR